RQGEEHPRRSAADGRRDRAGERGSERARRAHRRLDADAGVPGEDDGLLSARLSADADHHRRLHRHDPAAGARLRRTDAGAPAERQGELRAHGAGAHAGGAADHRRVHHQAAHDDAGADGAVRVPRHAPRRRQRGHLGRVHQGQSDADDHARGRGRADRDHGHARSDERELHALVQPERRQADELSRPVVQHRSDRAAARFVHAAHAALRRGVQPQAGGLEDDRLPDAGDHRVPDGGDRFFDVEDGDDPSAGGGRGDHEVLRSADAAHGQRARGRHAAARLLHDASVRRQLADQHVEPDARDGESVAHRRHRHGGRWQRHDVAEDDAGARRGALDAGQPVLRLPSAARSDALDPAEHVFLLLLSAVGSGDAGGEGPVRVPGRDHAGQYDRRLRVDAGDASGGADGVGAEAVLLGQLVGVRERRSRIPARGRRVQGFGAVVERARARASDVGDRDQHGGDAHGGGERAGGGGVTARSSVRGARQSARARRHLRARRRQREEGDGGVGDRRRAAVGRLRARLADPGLAQSAVAVLSRGAGEHLRGGGGHGHRRQADRAAAEREGGVVVVAGRGHRRLRLDGDGADVVRSAQRGRDADPDAALPGGRGAGRLGVGRAQVDLRGGVLVADVDRDRVVRRMVMKISRREALMSALFGAGYVGLRALATGLPATFLLNPRRALAAVGTGACADPTKAQYVILATSGNGDPINANVPGTYDDKNITHSLDPQMAATKLTIAGQPLTAAAPWATLPQSVLDRTAFFHLMTNTPVHPKETDVLKLMGATTQAEMLPSVLAKQLAPCLGTVQTQPITIGATSPSEGLMFGGQALPIIPPLSLKDTLASTPGPLTNLQALRDQTLNQLNDLYKNGASQAQRAYIDALVTSQKQIRNINQDLLAQLSSISDNTITSQITA